MKYKGRVFFVLPCARSGSTSLARILDGAANGTCPVEPFPNLNWETREMIEGRLADPLGVIDKFIVPRVDRAHATVKIYGEKNLTYGPFIPHLYKRFECKFILLVREGHEVVRSLMDWHNRMFGSIYRECQDPGNISPRAISAAANLPLFLDTSDYSRPRPQKNELYYDEWEDFTREEMCTYYWSETYTRYLTELDKIPSENWMRLDYSRVDAEKILQVAEFLGLSGLDETVVQTQLDSGINSLNDRIGEAPAYPKWANWSDIQKEKYWRLAKDCSKRLGIAYDA